MRVTKPAEPTAWPVKIATAPVNFGIYSARDPFISAAEYARIAVDCGYEGTDLGPLGYLDEVLAPPGRRWPAAGTICGSGRSRGSPTICRRWRARRGCCTRTTGSRT
ncbi:hypothetical protein ACFQ9X_44575 [Catenulispora yoronensis]